MSYVDLEPLEKKQVNKNLKNMKLNNKYISKKFDKLYSNKRTCLSIVSLSPTFSVGVIR